MTLEELEVVVTANAQKYEEQVKRIEGKTEVMSNRVSNSVSRVERRVSQLGNKLVKILSLAAITKFTKDCLDAGSDLAEVQNVVDVTFGNMSDKVNEFAKNAWQTVGLSETMAKKYMGNFGAMSKSMGFTVGQAEEMAETLTNLSGDVASFYNITQDEAYTKLKSVFTGETESLKELGVVMTQENLNAYALANGFGKTTDAMNQQEKTALRLAYVTSTLNAANGDFARTSNSWANQVRLLSLQFQSLKASIGQGLIAVLTPVIRVINTIMSKLVQMGNTFNSVLSSLGFSVSGGGSDGGGIALDGAVGGIDDATGAMDNLGGATEDVGKKAGKAKKQLEALMGIDEINKLKGNGDDSDGGSGGGGGAGGVGAISSPAIDTSATENSLNDMNARVKRILEELLSPLRTAWDNYGPWFLSKWDYFKNAFGYSCDALKNFLIAVWNHGGKEFVQHMAEIGIAVGGVALQIGGDILIALGNLWNHLNPDNNPYTRKFIDAMNSLAIAVRDFIISAGNWFGQFMNLGGQAFINCIGDIVAIVGTTLAKVFTDIINIVRAFMDSWAGHIIIQACALTLNIVAGAIKAVAIVIEKCYKVLEVFLVLWAAWKFKHMIEQTLLGNNALGKFIEKIVLLSGKIITNIADVGRWSLELGKNCVGALKSFGTAMINPKQTIALLSEKVVAAKLQFSLLAGSIKAKVVHGFEGLVDATKKNVTAFIDLTKSLKTNIIKWYEHVTGMLVAKATEKGLTVSQLALNVAMKACPIILLVSLIAGLVIAVKKIGDKFGWWTSISNALGKVLGWIGDKVGWVWDKVKGFFGWDTEPEVKENIEEIGTTAEETAKTTDDAFGTATSNVNIYLDSIHFNATRLAEEVDAATKSASEKFGMLSQSATEYLDAIKNHNTEKLAEMGDNQSIYNEEVKAMYADLTEAEKNEFLKQYGIVTGINDDILNYEGLKYDDRVARHAAYLETIQNDDSLSYQDKKAKMDQANADFQASIDSEVAKYQESITSKQAALDELLSTHGNTTVQGRMYEQQLRDEIDADRAHIEDITKTSYDNQVTTVEGATDAMAQANADSATAQEDAYKNIATTAEESMTSVNTSINVARINIQTFSSEATILATQLKNSFNGVGAKISNEFTIAGSSISTVLNRIKSMVASTTNTMTSVIYSSLNVINQMVLSGLNNMINSYNSAVRNINSLTNNLGVSMQSRFTYINLMACNTFANIRDSISRNIEIARDNVCGQLNSISYMFRNFEATLKVKIPHFYMTGSFNAETKEVPKVGVNYFAKGGVVDRATLGIVGEAGKEAIVPLENNTRGLDLLAEKLLNRMPQGKENNIGDGDLILQIDGSVVGKVALKQLRKMQRQGGITLIPT